MSCCLCKTNFHGIPWKKTKVQGTNFSQKSVNNLDPKKLLKPLIS